jgi:hypothetical protein
MVVRAYNPILGKLRQKDCRFETRLGFIARLCLRKRKEGKKEGGEGGRKGGREEGRKEGNRPKGQ